MDVRYKTQRDTDSFRGGRGGRNMQHRSHSGANPNIRGGIHNKIKKQQYNIQ